jgi:hypothetical protein
MRKFFLWCAGVDEDALRGCPKSEHIKQVGYGGLVLVPAVLAFISMTYAVSTLTKDRGKYIGIGIVWALIVFAFDRFIVSTYRKGETIAKDLRSITFLGRMILAVLVGIFIAHPLVLFIFDDSINAKLDQKRTNDIQHIERSYDEQTQPHMRQMEALNQQISQQESEPEGEIRRWENELNEVMKRRRSGRRAAQIRKTIERLTKERDNRTEGIKENIKKAEKEISVLRERRDRDLKNYTQARDYLARGAALDELIAASRTVRWSQYLIIALFVLIDVLPISFKVMTHKGAYDVALDSYNKREMEKIINEDGIYSDLLTQTTKDRKRRISETLKAKESEADLSAGVSKDIDTILNYSLTRGGITLAPQTVDNAVPVTSAVNPQGNGQPTVQKWPEKIREKLKDKGLDVSISFLSLPLQAVAAFTVFMATGHDVLQYVSWGTVLEIFPLFLLNFIFTGAVSRVTR